MSIDSIAHLLTIEGSERLATALDLVLTLHTRTLVLGTGAQATLPWNGDSVLAPGLVARVALLQERLATTFGVRSMSAGHREAFVSLSVADLNGLAFWLAAWGAGRP